MAMTNPRVRALLRQAERTANSGKRAAALQLYRQILDEEPRAVDAWLGLAQVTRDADERETALKRALELDPGNDRALELLDGAAPSAPKDTTAGPPEEIPEDPFSQSRAWLDEATARREKPARDDATKDEELEASVAREPALLPVPHLQVEEPDVVTAEVEPARYCYRHPKRETGLRCITCNRPICMQCAQHTPVGYRCPQCIREAQDVFFSANALDYLVTAAVTLVLALLAGYIAPRLGFFVIFIGPAAGTLIGRMAFRVARRRHGRYLPQIVAGLVAVGGLLPVGLPLLLALLGGAPITAVGFRLLWPLIYVFLATGAAYYQVK